MDKSKKIIALVTVFSLVITMIVPCNGALAEQITQEYVVMAMNDKAYNEVEDKYGEEVEETEELEDNNVIVVELTEREANRLEKDKNILLVEEDISFEGSDIDDELENIDVNDSWELKKHLKELREKDAVAISAEDQWNIDVINANSGEYEQGGEKIKVAVLDTGVTATEDIDLAGQVNFIEGEEDVNPLYVDISGHGTSVASVIAAKDNDIGVTGINPNVELYSVKVLDDEKKASLSGVIRGIYWCIENNINIINMSFGTSVESEILRQVVKEAESAGILMIAAAGNKGEVEGESTVEYPAAFEEVIAVGATNPQGDTSDISSLGKEVDLMAPGEKIPATGYFDEIIETNGTSMAAPHVTGVASVLWAKDKSKTSTFVKELMFASAKSLGDESIKGNGVVDLDYALSVYDEFAAQYTEEKQGNVKMVAENTQALEVYDDATVEASWGYSDHAYAVGLYDETGKSALNIVKIGSKIPDTASYLKYQSGKTDSFHGHYNYVANYIYVMRMARICWNSGMTQALKTAKYPCNGKGEEQIYNGIKELNKHWKTVLAGQTINNKNKARVLVGIAIHIGMDTYAHKAYIKDSKGKWTVHISGDAKQDSTSYVSSRWTCAKDIAYDIMDVWHYNLVPEGCEFYQLEHSKNKFRLFKFKTYVSSADKESYNVEPKWYNDRTSD